MLVHFYVRFLSPSFREIKGQIRTNTKNMHQIKKSDGVASSSRNLYFEKHGVVGIGRQLNKDNR